MNRKSKIIVSVVGISIVLLALLGITYAYYLTRIQGNTNTNSISVTTADLKLVYGDGNGLVTANDIMPGTTITKTFTVTNDGESKVENYVVVLENIVNTLTRTSDLTYTLECKLSDGTSCGSTELVDNKGPVFPSGVTEKAIFLNSIDKDVTHYYTLVVTYENLTNTDQSDDMGSSISALVNIKDKSQIDTTGLVNPSEVKLLANEIINNAKSNKNGTIYSPTPLTTPAQVVSGETERTLSVTQDNMGDGTSYYFRGSVQDNYVLFNNMCFRIVRIEGDGSVKLIYAGDVTEGTTTCNEVGTHTGLLKDNDGNILNTVYGHDGGDLADYESYSSGLEDAIETWYTTKFNTQSLQDKIKDDKWCLSGSDKYDEDGNLFTSEALEEFYNENGYYEYYYAAGNRVWIIKTTSLMCENEGYVESKYGTLIADEIMLAGGTVDSNESYYLFENAQEGWWTLSLATFDSHYDQSFYVGNNGHLRAGLSGSVESYQSGVRPSITLIPGTTIEGGDGTKTNPYAIN